MSSIVIEVKGYHKIIYQGQEYNFSPKWKRVTFRDLILNDCGIDIDIKDTEEKLLKEMKLKKIKVDLTGVIGFGALCDTLYKNVSRPKIIEPTFVTDYRSAMLPLAKKTSDPRKAGSFQLLVGGFEFLKAYNELNDPIDQKNRWEEEMALSQKGLDEHQVLDEDYIRALEYGMPPTAGWGLGIDRLVAFLTDQHTIKDTILFPTLRAETSSSIQNVTTTDSLPDEREMRFVAVLRDNIEPGKIMNALGHMAAGLAGGFEKAKEMCFLQYTDKNKGIHPNISHYPFIVLKVDNSNQIRKIREEAKNKGIFFTDFTSTMTIGSSADQVNATKETEEKDLDYFGICMFGKTSELKEFTGKFSLFK